MAIFDVREDRVQIDEIRFAERAVTGYRAFKIEPEEDDEGRMFISDGVVAVELESVEHTRNLIKALEEAIKLGWVK